MYDFKEILSEKRKKNNLTFEGLVQKSVMASFLPLPTFQRTPQTSLPSSSSMVATAPPHFWEEEGVRGGRRRPAPGRKRGNEWRQGRMKVPSIGGWSPICVPSVWPDPGSWRKGLKYGESLGAGVQDQERSEARRRRRRRRRVPCTRVVDPDPLREHVAPVGEVQEAVLLACHPSGAGDGEGTVKNTIQEQVQSGVIGLGRIAGRQLHWRIRTGCRNRSGCISRIRSIIGCRKAESGAEVDARAGAEQDAEEAGAVSDAEWWPVESGC